MKILIKNLKEIYGTQEPKEALRGKDLGILPHISDAWISIEDEKISALGSMEYCPEDEAYGQVIDANGRIAIPGFVDSHTHLVFANSREKEFEMRLHGKSYEEIAAAGGGILNSAKALRHTSESELLEKAKHRMDTWAAYGTGVFEIKSGYGLDLESELKMLRVIKQLKEWGKYPIKATFLGAHAYPMEYRDDHQGYLDIVCNEMIPAIANEQLAEYVDVFCEDGFFSVEESQQVLDAALKYGMKPKIHANQLHNSGGVQLGIKNNAISVDHLETLGDAEIEALSHSPSIATLLPGAAFFLGMHYQPARALIEAGAAISIASDFNPGSSPSGNLQLMWTLATTQMKMTTEEALNALTLNAAAALEWISEYGSIAPGKYANILITKEIPDIAYIPYAYGQNHIDFNFVHGKNVLQ